jgi:predicted alpha/beta hydrolase
LCAPFFEEKSRSYRILNNFAQLLCSQGYPVLSFDYRGHGDSGGMLEHGTLESHVSDIRGALSILMEKTGVEKTGILGLRIGGTLALYYAAVSHSVSFLILWEPIMDTQKYFFDYLKINIASQIIRYRKIVFPRQELAKKLTQGGTISVDGYPISGRLFSSFDQRFFFESLKNYYDPCLIVNFQDENKNGKDNDIKKLESYLTEWSREEIEMRSVDSKKFYLELGNQGHYDPCPEELFSLTLKWMQSHETRKYILL